ncbi:MAG: type IV pilin protein [Thiohalobacteraceae bacterium]
MTRPSRTRGMTLMELLIALAIVALLATLAYPSYRDSLMRGRRTDAIGSLLALRVAEETWRANHTAYADLHELGHAATSADGCYHLQVPEHTAAGFLAIARPRADGPQRGDACGTYAIDQHGPVLTGGYADAVCWRR